MAMIKKTTSVAGRVLLMTPEASVRIHPIAVELVPPPRHLCRRAHFWMRSLPQQVNAVSRFLQRFAARHVQGHCLPLAALLLGTMMSVAAAQAASRRVAPITQASGSGVPTYNIQAACRQAAAIPEARLFEASGPDTIKRCVDDENRAREQLVELWARVKAADRAMCAGASRSGPADPTYTELITCLEMTRDNPGGETVVARRARAEPPRSAAADASSSPVIARAPIVEQVMLQPTGTAQQTAAQFSALDQPPAPSSEKGVAAETQVGELNQTIENLRSELASSQGRIANLEKDKEDAQRAATQAEQTRRDLELAKRQIEQASVAKEMQPDAKNHRLAIVASTATVALVILLAITVFFLRRRVAGRRPA
jgi:hypothetical protein